MHLCGGHSDAVTFIVSGILMVSFDTVAFIISGDGWWLFFYSIFNLSVIDLAVMGLWLKKHSS